MLTVPTGCLKSCDCTLTRDSSIILAAAVGSFDSARLLAFALDVLLLDKMSLKIDEQLGERPLVNASPRWPDLDVEQDFNFSTLLAPVCDKVPTDWPTFRSVQDCDFFPTRKILLRE